MKKGEMHPLRVARCQHNLTIVELAEETKVGASTIWRAEQYHSINAESRRRICTFFAMSPQELGLLGRSKQNPAFAQKHAKVYPFIEPCTPAYIAEKVSAAQLLTLSEGTDARQFFTQKEQPETVSALEVNGLAALLDAHWTLDTMLDALHPLFQGLQSLPSRLQHALLLGMLSRTDIFSSLDNGCPNDGQQAECSQVTEVLSTCIAQSQQFCRNANPIQVLLVGLGLLYLLRQMQKSLSQESHSCFYESITKLIGSALFFQEYCNESSDALQIEQIQVIETALRLLRHQDETDYQNMLANSKNSLKSLSPVFGQQPSFVDY